MTNVVWARVPKRGHPVRDEVEKLEANFTKRCCRGKARWMASAFSVLGMLCCMTGGWGYVCQGEVVPGRMRWGSWRRTFMRSCCRLRVRRMASMSRCAGQAFCEGDGDVGWGVC